MATYEERTFNAETMCDILEKELAEARTLCKMIAEDCTKAKKKLTECQALVKVKDEALLVLMAIDKITDEDRLYSPSKVAHSIDNAWIIAHKALAQTSGTEALDKLIAEAEQRGYDKCWNEFAGMEAVAWQQRGIFYSDRRGICVDDTQLPLIQRPERK